MKKYDLNFGITVLAALFTLCITIAGFAGQPLKTGIDYCTDGSKKIDCPAQGEEYYGQDGCYQKGQSRSYTKLGPNETELADSATQEDGWCMTRDNTTGLIWEVKTAANKTDTFSWDDAQAYCENLTHGGFSDWRCPTLKELQSLMNFGIAYPGPVIDTDYFPNCDGDNKYYWSSTLWAGDSDYGYDVDLSYGYSYCLSVSGLTDRVIAVRAGQDGYFDNAFVDNGDGTITDNSTGLMWQQGSIDDCTWSTALETCEDLTLAGYSDWRLPNLNELMTLIDHSKYGAPIDDIFSISGIDTWYYSSSPFTGYPDYVWMVDFGNGYWSSYLSAYYCARAVRTVKSDDGQAKSNISPAVQVLLD